MISVPPLNKIEEGETYSRRSMRPQGSKNIFLRSALFAANGTGFSHYLEGHGMCSICYLSLCTECDLGEIVGEQEARKHNKLQHTLNGNIDRAVLTLEIDRDWVDANFTGFKIIRFEANPARIPNPTKVVRFGDGSGFTIPELWGTTYALTRPIIQIRVGSHSPTLQYHYSSF